MSAQPTDPETDRMPDDAAMRTAYLQAAHRVISIARSGGRELAETWIPSCPAWTARDLLAHVTSVAGMVVAPVDMGGDPQAWVDGEIAKRAGRTLGEIGQEFEDLLPGVERGLAGHSPGALIVDLVTHEHDLRAALGQDFIDHTLALDEALSATVAWVRGLELVKERGALLRSPTSRFLFGGPEVALEVDFPDDWELWRTLGVRRSKEQLQAYPHSGDLRLLFDVTSRYPLPEHPLID